jgi:hypothetical protein
MWDIMSIKRGDKIRYVRTNEDGEVVSESKVSPDCVMVRFGESFEYVVEKEKLALVAHKLPQTVIHR